MHAVPVKFPVEGAGMRVDVILESADRLSQLIERIEVVWCKQLPLNDREVDLNLVDPASMHRCVQQHDFREPLMHPLDRLLASVSGVVVHDPEDPSCPAVGILPHDLMNQPFERFDAFALLTTADCYAPVDIPSSQVVPSTLALVIMLQPSRFVGTCASR